MGSAKTKLLHIGVARIVQSVHTRPLQLWTKLPQKEGQCQNLCSHVFVKRVELWLELIANLDNPTHIRIMT